MVYPFANYQGRENAVRRIKFNLQKHLSMEKDIEFKELYSAIRQIIQEQNKESEGDSAGLTIEPFAYVDMNHYPGLRNNLLSKNFNSNFPALFNEVAMGCNPNLWKT